MIDVKKAVQLASDYLKMLYDDASDIRLEETEFLDGPPERWAVTLSFQQFPTRLYKLFEIDANSGEVRAMRIRQIA